jgi:hypothetical protein
MNVSNVNRKKIYETCDECGRSLIHIVEERRLNCPSWVRERDCMVHMCQCGNNTKIPFPSDELIVHRRAEKLYNKAIQDLKEGTELEENNININAYKALKKIQAARSLYLEYLKKNKDEAICEIFVPEAKRKIEDEHSRKYRPSFNFSNNE